MIARILDWAAKNNSVRSILLVGSLAGSGKQDELSDYDISIFGDGFDFIEKDDWLLEIAKPIVCIHEKFFWDDTRIPTRLTIFEKLIKVDFAFHPLSLLEKMTKEQRLSATYDAGYEVLLDKDGSAAGLPRPGFNAYFKTRPDPGEYDNCVREFWFEAYHVAKYLAREDLWVAHSRDHAMKNWLLAMLQWNAVTKSGIPLRMKPEGKNINDWILPAYKSKLASCFAGWNPLNQRLALYETVGLFNDVAKETASSLQYDYSENIGKEITDFISNLVNSSHDSKNPL